MLDRSAGETTVHHTPTTPPSAASRGSPRGSRAESTPRGHRRPPPRDAQPTRQTRPPRWPSRTAQRTRPMLTCSFHQTSSREMTCFRPERNGLGLLDTIHCEPAPPPGSPGVHGWRFGDVPRRENSTTVRAGVPNRPNARRRQPAAQGTAHTSRLRWATTANPWPQSPEIHARTPPNREPRARSRARVCRHFVVSIVAPHAPEIVVSAVQVPTSPTAPACDYVRLALRANPSRARFALAPLGPSDCP